VTDSSRWYQEALIYQLRVRSFCDSNDDGIGDFPGLTSKLDYLKDLGVTALWLLPFYPSPLRDDGYDISDYTSVHPDLGTLTDVRQFLRQAHRRNLRVITELVMNHTSDHHPWFERARRAPPGSRERDFYVWSDDPALYKDARIIFKDFESSNWSWDPVAGAYYWHRFYSHQPDLNFENPAVRREMFRALDFWFRLGVDGVRLDAIPYLYEREGTSCENLPETHAFLRELRAHVDAHFSDRMLLAEANQWPEDAVAYFGKGDECHMAFHFPIMPRLFMALHMESREPVLDILSQTPEIPPICQWAIFLRNHDELTLEMVTDEERDYMWRVYARDTRARINLGIRHRLAPLLQNSRRRIELMQSLLLSLGGTPILYYGDEIGMGDNIYLGDRDAVRTPMQWSPDRNAGFSRANPQRLFLPVVSDPEYSPDAVNVEVQERNASSLLSATKRMLALRRRFRAFGRGSFEALAPANRSVIAFVRRFEGECLLVVANLSRNPQYAELDLREFAGRTPVELFGRTDFPRIGELPYLVTLGPHGFFWFALEAEEPAESGVAAPHRLPELTVREAWTELVRGEQRDPLESALKGYLPRQRWFRSKALEIRSVAITDAIPVGDAQLALVRVSYAEREPEEYVLPLQFRLGSEDVERAVARVHVEGPQGNVEGYLFDASGDPAFGSALLDIAARGRRVRGSSSRLVGVPARSLRQRARSGELPAPKLLGVEQSNTSWRYGDQLVAKLLRRLDPGPSPELVLGRHLSETVHYPNTPSHAGHLELQRPSQPTSTLALLQSWVPSEGDAWEFTLHELDAILDEGPESVGEDPEEKAAARRAAMRIESFGESAHLLGQRTGELHTALAGAPDDPQLRPEPLTPFVRRGQAQAIRNLAVRNLNLLASRLEAIPPSLRSLAEEVLARRAEIERRAHDITEVAAGGQAIRCHGDYHLGQVLFTGEDFVILDFEGEPARSLAERSRKRTPLVDVAGMLRSFDYAAEFTRRGREGDREGLAEEHTGHEPWLRRWSETVRRAFLEGYYKAVQSAKLLPERSQADRILAACLLEKALYEIGYELNNRPEWLAIPLRGVRDLLDPGSPP
jgi:maltose alpha-D-glucosyltransferase / alpha-amylase